MNSGSFIFLLLLGSITECSSFFDTHEIRRWKRGDQLLVPCIWMVRTAEYAILDDKESKLSKALITDKGRAQSKSFGEHVKEMPLSTFISSPVRNAIDTIKQIKKSAGLEDKKYTWDKLLSHSSFHKQPHRVANLIKDIGRARFYKEHLEPWLNGGKLDYLYPMKERADEILDKYRSTLKKGITLIVARVHNGSNCPCRRP